MTCKQIVFTEINKAELIDTELPELGANMVKVKTEISSISCGTERANITGDPNVNCNGKPEVVFPRHSGYSSSGTVVEVGSDVKSVKVGDRVAMFWSSHKEYNVLPETNVVKIEYDNVSFKEAALGHIANFPMAAVRKTKLEMGESMMVMGLGILGLFAVQLAHAAGAVPVIAVDPVKERREKALKFGADYAFDPFDEDFAKKVKEVTHGGVNAAVEVTGNGAGLNETLDCMARFGRVALLGCTRNSDFTVDYYRKVHGPGISLIGAHTLARPNEESHPGYFTHRDDLKAYMKLVAMKRINMLDIIDETYSPKDCGEVYTRLINDRSFPVVSQFDWSLL